MAGLKERHLKRYQRGETEWNPIVRKILDLGSIGHSEKHRRRMGSDPSITEKMMHDGHRMPSL